MNPLFEKFFSVGYVKVGPTIVTTGVDGNWLGSVQIYSTQKDIFLKDKFTCVGIRDFNNSITEELWGCPPTLIVLDNLMDVATDGGEEFASMRAIMKELKYLARATNSAVMVLHHTSEAVMGTPCQPRSALQGKVAQLPALICTLGTVGTSLGVASVKNRYGRADAGGTLITWLAFNPEYMYVEDIPENS